MGIKQRIIDYVKSFDNSEDSQIEAQNIKQSEIDASYNGDYSVLMNIGFDGEKTAGEIGPAINYIPQFKILRVRSWQSFIESDVTQMVYKRFLMWVLGNGLKLKSEPNEVVLKSEGVTLDVKEFSKITENRFQVYSRLKLSSHNGEKNLHNLAKSAYKNASIGGDVLQVLRFEKGIVNCQIIDGAHINTPFSLGSIQAATKKGHTILNGVEHDKKGKVVAYWVTDINHDSKRIKAFHKDRYGNVTTRAKLIFGLEYRLDTRRGMPLIACILETLKKLDRYKEATVGSAEERQKIAYSIEHTRASTGENPLVNQLQQSFKQGHGEQPETTSYDGEAAATKVAQTTQKTAINMPIDSTLKLLESKNELYFKEFFDANIDIICASIEIPPNVARQIYDSNFSASRAALKDWEHTLIVKRHEFSQEFYQNVYEFWLTMEVLSGKIKAPGYLDAIINNNEMILGAYQTSRFIGKSIPHIDPVKEVKAERAKLGKDGERLPLTTAEKATENLNEGDYNSNVTQFNEELELLIEEEKEPVVPPIIEPIIKE